MYYYLNLLFVTKEPELYLHHLLMLYFPWRDETSLLGSDQTYASKFYEHKVQAVVERDRETFEPDADAVTEALEYNFFEITRAVSSTTAMIL